MEFAITIAAEYSGVLAPVLAFWATLLLHIQPRHSHSSVVQTAYFFTLLLVAVLTLRATADHDRMWLANAGSLGVLIVAGALRRPTDEVDSIALHSEA